MKFRYIICLLCFSSLSSVFSQKAIDTVETSKGRLVIFENRTWGLLNESTFNGTLNARIHALVSKNNPPFTQAWNNETCYTGKNNDLSKLADTIRLNLTENVNDVFTVPVKGVVTSHYGYRDGRYHKGIDLALRIGDTVYAAFSGKIRYAKYNEGGFGNLVIIRHHNSLETFYAHLSKHLVVPNQDVVSGQPIGLGGITGRSFGPHLHFEVRFYDGALNPEELINFTTKKLKKDVLFLHKKLFAPGAAPSVYYEPNNPNNANDKDSIIDRLVNPVVKVNAAQKKYYTVKSGDTLSSIASKNKTTVAILAKLNGIKPSSKLTVGKNIRIK